MDEKKALDRFSTLCSKSEHCEYDIREKMRNTDLDDDAKERIISYLKKERYIDEKRYAEIFVRDKAMFNGWGPAKIRFELQHRHISSAAIEDGLAQLDDNVFDDQLMKAMTAKLRQTHTDDKLKLKASLFRFGASRGFSYDQISSVVEKLLQGE